MWPEAKGNARICLSRAATTHTSALVMRKCHTSLRSHHELGLRSQPFGCKQSTEPTEPPCPLWTGVNAQRSNKYPKKCHELVVTRDGAVRVLSKHEEQNAPGEEEAREEHGEVEPPMPQEQQDAADEQQGGTEQLGQGGDC